MTAFLQGISQFVPEIQPYQPDLNFFGNMLATKQYQYDQGYNRINSIYSGLLNSPVLRQESSERRDQFFRDIEQKIQKISTMDLSLEQNVNAAAKIFQPLIEDKDINFDMGMTRIWQREMQRGQKLKNTMDPKVLENGMWWEGGDRALNYWAQDFAKSSAEDMYKMPKPEYTPYLNITKLASDQLDKMDFPMGINPTWTPDGKYIIQGKGGPMTMAPLYNYLLNMYGNDPRVIKVAQTEAYLKRKDFVSQNAQAMGGEQNAETQYLNNILNQVNVQAQRFQEQATTNAKVAKAKTKVISNAIANGDIYDPDKTLNNILGNNEEQAQVEEGAAQFHNETLQITNPEVLKASDFGSLRNRADVAVARDLLSEKLYNTAMNYAELNKEIKIDADPYAKAAFDNALDRSNMLLQAQIDQAKMQLQSQLNVSEMEYEMYLKDYYGDSQGKGSGSGSGKGNNGIDQRNPYSQDGWLLGDELTVTPGGSGTDGEQLTGNSIKSIVEGEVAAYENITAPILQSFATTLDKLYETAVGSNPDEALVAREAILKAFSAYLKPGQGQAALKASNQEYANWFNLYKNQVDLSGVSFSDPSKNDKGDYQPSFLEKNVANLKSALGDSAVLSILKSKLNMNQIYSSLDQSELNLALLRVARENQAYNNELVSKRTLQAVGPITSVLPARIDVEKRGDQFHVKYSDVDPTIEKNILVETNQAINERYNTLKKENPKKESGDLWDDAQEYGKEYYTKKMKAYFQGPGMASYSSMSDNGPFGSMTTSGGAPILYKWNGERVSANDAERGYKTKNLEETLNNRFDVISKTYNKTWNTIGGAVDQAAALARGEDPNNIEKLKTLTSTLYGSNAGGGLVGKVYRSDIDGAYAKNPGNSDYRQVFTDLENYMQTHKKNDGSFTLFSGKLSGGDDFDINDVLGKDFNDEAYQVLQQLRTDMSNAGSWKSNQATRPRALMDVRFNVAGSGFDALTFRVDGGYIKGLKESASKELTQEEQASEVSSSSLSDAREYTLMVPSGSFNNEFMTQLKKGDVYKDYVRNVGPININYNDVGRQRFSGNATIRFDQPTQSYIAAGQINMIDPNTGSVIQDPNGIINTVLGENDNLGIWKKTTEQLLEVRNQQLINDFRTWNQYYKKSK